MSRATTRGRVTTPTVNLLSSWSFDALAARRLRRRFATGAVLLSLLLVGGWAAQDIRADHAEKVLLLEEAERAALTAQTAELAPVKTFVAAVAKREQTVTETMRTEVRFSRVLAELAMSTPADAELTSISVTLTPPSAAPGGEADAAGTDPGTDPATGTAGATASVCPGPDPFGTRPVVGCLTLSGTAASRDAIGQLVVDLGRSSIFVEPFISTTTTAEGPQVAFTGTVGLAPSAFSARYDDLDTLLRERLQP